MHDATPHLSPSRPSAIEGVFCGLYDKTLKRAADEFLKILSKAGNDNDEARKKFIALNS